ncbi:MAG: hypothetical protein QF536_07160 [Arenicellales bacterium]|jgi:hypothetical protein|nr:hypothetical protein [Arenicellales bacterium]MDP6435377.1 hypothetical protein [Arenicellales bacterium]MDP6672105.1 hypothetical protein [Arenicellales bacterium]MDP6724961.1 hypothetical protein [Arenicellales bacterium]MDP7522031.1 hypothetical protein [Arenicellales bacterium]|tara:strand:+ start:453 stop:656 length:204 start_codon:yes stop_codon:yes gene_type:complete
MVGQRLQVSVFACSLPIKIKALLMITETGRLLFEKFSKPNYRVIPKNRLPSQKLMQDFGGSMGKQNQ